MDLACQQGSYALTSCIYVACLRGHLAVVQYLVSRHGADPKMKREHGDSVLYAAAEKGHLHIVRWLIEEHNAFVDDADVEDVTPLCKPPNLFDAGALICWGCFVDSRKSF